jgi:hypothetical protein
VTPDSQAEILKTVRNVRRGDRQTILAAMRKTLKRNPNNLRALLILAGLTLNEKEAVAALDRALQLDPDNEIAHRSLVELRAGRQPQAQDRQSPQPFSLPNPFVDETAGRPPKPYRDGTHMVALAKSVTWPFKDLNRPVGKLLASGQVTWRDLSWASRRAYDPIVKWAAAVCLEADALKGIRYSPASAAQVIWPFKDLQRPIGELLDEHVLNLHDLAYAVANAHDPKVRNAAATLGAEIVRPQIEVTPERSRPSREETPDEGLKEATRGNAASNARTRAGRDRSEKGQLHVAKGSAYLRQQETKKAQQKQILALFGIGLLILAVGSSLVGGIAALAGFTRHFWRWTGLSVIILGGAWWLVPRVDQLRMEAQAFAKGRRGEERLVAFLREKLDGHWVLFRNIVLPGSQGDIDAILIGLQGIYALEVKAYSGYYRNQGKRWWKRVIGVWRTIDHNPTRQALRNAQRLHEYLASQGVDVWVEPRVVWAGSGKVWLERPAVRVWQFSRPAHVMGDLEEGTALSPEVIRQVVRGLIKARRAQGVSEAR